MMGIQTRFPWGIVIMGVIFALGVTFWWGSIQLSGDVRPVVRVLPHGIEPEVLLAAIEKTHPPADIPLFTETAITVNNEETGEKVEVFRLQFDGETVYIGEEKVTVPVGETFFFKGMIGIRKEGNSFIFVPEAEFLAIVYSLANPRPAITATPAITTTPAVTTTPTTPPNPTATAAHTISLP